LLFSVLQKRIPVDHLLCPCLSVSCFNYCHILQLSLVAIVIVGVLLQILSFFIILLVVFLFHMLISDISS
jgi:hypothetical protein